MLAFGADLERSVWGQASPHWGLPVFPSGSRSGATRRATRLWDGPATLPLNPFKRRKLLPWLPMTPLPSPQPPPQHTPCLLLEVDYGSGKGDGLTMVGPLLSTPRPCWGQARLQGLRAISRMLGFIPTSEPKLTFQDNIKSLLHTEYPAKQDSEGFLCFISTWLGISKFYIYIYMHTHTHTYMGLPGWRYW